MLNFWGAVASPSAEHSSPQSSGFVLTYLSFLHSSAVPRQGSGSQALQGPSDPLPSSKFAISLAAIASPNAHAVPHSVIHIGEGALFNFW